MRLSDLHVKGITPMFNGILCTAELNGQSGSFATPEDDEISLIQTVVSVGERATTVKKGDLIKISPLRYIKARQKSQGVDTLANVEKFETEVKPQWNTIQMNGRKFLYIYDNDVEYVISDYDVKEKTLEEGPGLVIPGNKPLIL